MQYVDTYCYIFRHVAVLFIVIKIVLVFGIFLADSSYIAYFRTLLVGTASMEAINNPLYHSLTGQILRKSILAAEAGDCVTISYSQELLTYLY